MRQRGCDMEMVCKLNLLIILFLSGLGFLPGQTYASDQAYNQDVLVIKHARTRYEYFKERENYLIELLTLAMNKSGASYTIEGVNLTPLTQNRSIHYVKSGTYTVHWLNTSAELEEILLPVRIPLFKGMIGWRLLIIRRSDTELFSKLNTLEEIKRFKILQGDDWPDTPILEQNGFDLVTSADFETLSKMLARGRGDMFPRSVTEIWEEMKSYSDLDVVIEDHLALEYPAAFYYFVERKNIPLKNAIEKGLNIAVKDGSFDELFLRYFGAALERAKLDKRLILRLPNPLMSEQTPLNRKELWLKPIQISEKYNDD